VADLCLRKWWLQREAYLREPQKQSFIIGGKVHDAGERYLGQQGELWPAGWDDGLIHDPALGIHQREVVQTGVEAAIQAGIWSPVPGSYIEYPICMLIGRDLVDGRGLPLLARADLYTDEEGIRRVATPTALMDGSPLPAGWDALPYLIGFIDHYIPAGPETGAAIPVVVDHKTAKNMRYGKKQQDIQTGIQIPIYGAAALALQPEHDAIIGRYNVFIKDPQSSKRVYMVEDQVSLDHILQVWDHVITQTEVMVANKKQAPRVGSKKDPGRAANFWKVCASLEDESACRAFGGCPYRDLCYERCSPEQITRRMDDALTRPAYQPTHQPAAKTQGPSLLQRLRQSKENPMPFGTPPPPETPPAPIIKVGDTAFIADPDDGNLFYKVYIHAIYQMNGVNQSDIIIYPHVDISVDLDTLPEIYKQTVPADLLLTEVPKVNDYYEELKKAGWPEGKIQYTALTQAQDQNDPYAGAATAQVAPKGEALAAAQQPDPKQLDEGTQAEAEALAEAGGNVNVETYQQWVGQKIHIDNGAGNSFRGLCTEVTEEGMRVEGFDSIIKWPQVVRVTSMETTPRPGDEEDKKRIDTKQDMDSLNVQTCYDRIKTIFEEKKEKETLGKREYRKIVVYLEKLQELISQQTLPLGSGDGADTEEAFKKGIKEGIKQAEAAVHVLLIQP
jgi:hypothetical protein